MSANPIQQLFLGTPEGSPVSGVQLRDWGIEDALVRAVRIKNEYVEACLDAIGEFPCGSLITSEDIRDRAGDPPLEVNHSILAGIMKHAASKKHNLIVITGGTRQAKRASVHAKKLSVWRRV